MDEDEYRISSQEELKIHQNASKHQKTNTKKFKLKKMSGNIGSAIKKLWAATNRIQKRSLLVLFLFEFHIYLSLLTEAQWDTTHDE